jgi:arylsulfatase A-like enzyme
MLEAMDFHIGRLIQHLKASGQYENTIFIVSSDNVLCWEAAAGFSQQISMRRQPSARHAF